MNAGPQQFLGVSDATDRAGELASEFGDILGRAIGQGRLGLGPDEFIRVEFWSVGRKRLDMKPVVLAQEVLDDDAFVDRASIPKQHHRSPQMPKQIAQESNDLHTRDVGCVQAQIEAKSYPAGRDGDSGDGGDPITPVAVSEDRGLSDRCPGLANVRNEEEAAFVEEGEMGPKSLGFFLYAATWISSTGRSLPRLFAWPDVPVSAMSTPSSASLAKHGPGGRGPQNAARSASLCAAGSTNPLRIQLPEPPVSGVAAVRASAVVTTAAAFPTQAWAAERSPHPPESSEPSAPPSLWKHSRSRPPIDRSCQHGATSWRGTSVPPAVEGFLGVSCPIG